VRDQVSHPYTTTGKTDRRTELNNLKITFSQDKTKDEYL
jgi:hypothetical protein